MSESSIYVSNATITDNLYQHLLNLTTQKAPVSRHHQVSDSHQQSQSSPPTRPWDFGEITLLLLLIFGTIGNGLTIMVMRTKRMRNSNASLFIICMAISDIILLVLKFTANMIKIYRIPIYNLCILIQVVPQAAMFISVWLIVITSAERTVAVMAPLKVAYIFSKKHCKIIMSCMFVFFFLISSSVSVCIHYMPDHPHYCQIKGTKEGKCYVYYNFIFPWIKSALSAYLPSIIGIILNIVIICELFRASKRRRHITSNYYSNDVNGSSTYSAAQRNKKKAAPRSMSIPNTTTFVSSKKSSTRSPRVEKMNELVSKSLDREEEDMYGNRLADGEEQQTALKHEGSIESIIVANGRPRAKSLKRQQSMMQSLRSLTKGIRYKASAADREDSIYNSQTAIRPPQTNTKEKQITIMLLTAAISFIILTMPYSTYELFRKLGFTHPWLRNRNVMRALMMLIDINHATNFILYCLTAQRFRTELRAILLCESWKQQQKRVNTNAQNNVCYYGGNNGHNNHHQQQVSGGGSRSVVVKLGSLSSHNHHISRPLSPLTNGVDSGGGGGKTTSSLYGKYQGLPPSSDFKLSNSRNGY